jgi:hypothetical protein
MKKSGRYKEKLDWDDMTQGEASHHIGKKMTQKVEKSKKDFKRKPKHRYGENDEFGYYPDRDL